MYLLIDGLDEKQKETAKKILALLDGYTVEEAKTLLHSVGSDLPSLARLSGVSEIRP